MRPAAVFALISVPAIILLGLLLYAPTLDLLLFWDDVPHMQWLDAQQDGHYWISSAGFPFYRPATFAVWDTLHALLGQHDPLALHLLSVTLHIANALLVSGLARRLSGRWTAGLWAGFIFVAFPFSYQAVIPTAAHFHLLQLFGLLSAAWLLLDWVTSEQTSYWRLITAWLLAFWGIFSHENGILAPLLVGGILLAGQTNTFQWHWRKIWQETDFRRIVIAITPIGIISAIYGVIWQIVPKANEETGLKLDALDAKIGQTMQSIGFPLAAFFQEQFQPEDGKQVALASGAIVLVILLGWLAIGWRQYFKNQQTSRSPLFTGTLALLWIPLVMLPAWLFLDVNYLLGSPRLQYLASAGIAWAWGSVLGQPFGKEATRPWKLTGWATGAIATGICLWVAVPFVIARVDEHREINQIYRAVGEKAVAPPRDGMQDKPVRLLMVNGPAYLAPRDSTFLLGSEGSTYLPDFINLGDFLVLNQFAEPDELVAHNRRADDVVPDTQEIFSVTAAHLDRASISEYDIVTRVMQLEGELLAPVVGKQVQPSDSGKQEGNFGNGVVLTNTNFDVYEDGILRLKLGWHVTQAELPFVEVFVHLLCDGQLVTQADGPPIGKLYRHNLWPAGESWQDYRYIELPDNQDKECLAAFVGLYPDPETGGRFLLPDGHDGVIIPLED
jgi:hypothetical protein